MNLPVLHRWRSAVRVRGDGGKDRLQTRAGGALCMALAVCLCWLGSPWLAPALCLEPLHDVVDVSKGSGEQVSGWESPRLDANYCCDVERVVSAVQGRGQATFVSRTARAFPALLPRAVGRLWGAFCLLHPGRLQLPQHWDAGKAGGISMTAGRTVPMARPWELQTLVSEQARGGFGLCECVCASGADFLGNWREVMRRLEEVLRMVVVW